MVFLLYFCLQYHLVIRCCHLLVGVLKGQLLLGLLFASIETIDTTLPVFNQFVLLALSFTDHIALIIELLGKIPRKLILAGRYSKDFFTKKGKTIMHYPVLSCPHT